MIKEMRDKIAESWGWSNCECGILMRNCKEHYLDVPTFMRTSEPPKIGEASIFPLDPETE